MKRRSNVKRKDRRRLEEIAEKERNSGKYMSGRGIRIEDT